MRLTRWLLDDPTESVDAGLREHHGGHRYRLKLQAILHSCRCPFLLV